MAAIFSRFQYVNCRQTETKMQTYLQSYVRGKNAQINGKSISNYRVQSKSERWTSKYAMLTKTC